MQYVFEIYDPHGRRVAWFDDAPIIEVARAAPDEPDRIRGLLPTSIAEIGPGYTVRASVGDRLVCEAIVTQVRPSWSDERKLIFDRYVHFHETLEFEAERPARHGNTSISRAYTNRSVQAIVKDAINSAPGGIHYTVDHNAYPDGAAREHSKFLARKTADNELEVGGIDLGQWVGAARIDASAAYAKDGDTVAGLVVDGAAWPDMRLMLIDCEETALNSHAIKRHPELADWTEEQYAASGYKLRADAATAALQALLGGKGIDYIELNPHRDASGAFDDRVDAYGRYIGLVHGGGECFNAAMVEQGHADVYLYEDGRYHVPEMALKEFFSYAGPHTDSICDAPQTLSSYDFTGGVLELLAAMAYAADGCTFAVGPDLTVRFERVERPARVIQFDAVETGVQLGSDADGLGNVLYVNGNPASDPFSKTYSRDSSIGRYGAHVRFLNYFALSKAEDADRLAEGLLDDVAYPEPHGAIQFHAGDDLIDVGDVVEVRGDALRRVDAPVDGEWGGRFADRLVGRVRRVVHRFTGRVVTTVAELTSPLRSVSEPLAFLVRSQPGATILFQFRLDDAEVGLDLGYHLD